MASYRYGAQALDDKINYVLLSKHFDMPQAPLALYKIAHRFGKKKTGATPIQRQITVIVRVLGSSRANLESKLDTLYQGLNIPGQTLYLHLLDTRYYIADCIGTTAEFAAIKGGGFPGSAAVWADVTISFVCFNPYAAALAATTYTTYVPRVFGGTLLASPFAPIDTAAQTMTGSGTTWTYYKEIAGVGTTWNRPQVRVYQQGTSLVWTSLKIEQLTNNQTITVTSGLPVTSGDYLDFFCDPTATNGYSVQLNSSGTPLPFTGIFPVMESIATAWRFTVNAPSAPSIRVMWLYNARYLT